MRTRLLVNLLLLLGAAALLIWIAQRPNGQPMDTLSTLEAASVRQIEVRRRGEQTLTFERHAAGWRMLTPAELPASDYHLDLILGLLGQPVAVRYPLEEINLAAAGLAQPMLTITFDGKGYAFGNLDPLGQRRYIRYEGEVLLVQEGVSAILASPWWNFVDRRLLPTGEPAKLRHADGRVDVLAENPSQQAHWWRSSAAIVRPIPAGLQGEPLVLELASGETIDWQWVGGDSPRLLRPDLGLFYQISPEQLDALLGRAARRPTE